MDFSRSLAREGVAPSVPGEERRDPAPPSPAGRRRVAESFESRTPYWAGCWIARGWSTDESFWDSSVNSGCIKLLRKRLGESM